MLPFRVVRIGFDTIIIAVRGWLSAELREELTAAHRKARDQRSPEPIELRNVSGEVLAHGVQGGYDAVFSTGTLGEMFQFKTDQKGDEWPVRVKIRAASLLVHGYPGAVEIALERLYGILAQNRVIDVRLSEVHVCIDVLTDAGFRLDESRFVRPGRSIVRPYETFDNRHPLADEFDEPEMRRVLRGLRLQTLAIGSRATGSQTVIYNKRDEANLRRNQLFFDAYKLDRTDRSWALWRSEFRFSGLVLKRRFCVRTFSDLNVKNVDMLDWASARIRYDAPGQERTHTTRRKLEPFWKTVREAVPTFSAAQPSMIPPSLAQGVLDRERKEALERCAVGTIIACEAMNGGDPDAFAITSQFAQPHSYDTDCGKRRRRFARA